MRKMIRSHDVLEPLKQVLLASRDVIISGQICGSNRGKFFTLGDGCWPPNKVQWLFWTLAYICLHIQPFKGVSLLSQGDFPTLHILIEILG